MPKSIQNRVAAPPLLFSVRPGAFDIVAFGRSKFVHNFRQKIDYPSTNRVKMNVENEAKIDRKLPLSLSAPFPFQPGAFDIVAFARSKFVCNLK